MQYVENKELLSAYVENPFDILIDQDFIFESIFNSSGFFALLKSIYRSEKYNYELKVGLYMTPCQNSELRKLLLYYVARFSFRYSYLAYLNDYNVLSAVKDVSVFCKIKNLDRRSKSLLKRELLIAYKPQHQENVIVPNSKLYHSVVLSRVKSLLVLVEIDKISPGHLRKILQFIGAKYGELLLQSVLLEIEDHTFDGLLDLQNKSVEKILGVAQQFLPNLFKV